MDSSRADHLAAVNAFQKIWGRLKIFRLTFSSSQNHSEEYCYDLSLIKNLPYSRPILNKC